MNATGCGKFEYGICLLVSPSLFAKAGRKERTGCEGRMRFVIGATSAVCKVALMFAPFVLSRPHLCSLLRFSSRFRPGSERIVFFPYRVVSFSLLLILVTFNHVCFHFSQFFLSTLFLCHLLSLTYLFDLFPFSLPASLFISTLRSLRF